jgi:ketosteroid isomerase-like protein
LPQTVRQAPEMKGENGMPDDVELLRRVYALFNRRDIESVLAAMQPDVVWANGMEGGHVHGRDGVRTYWKRQWEIVDPYVEPLQISSNGKASCCQSSSGRA